MTADLAEAGPAARTLGGARHGRAAVTRILRGEVPVIALIDGEHAEATTSFLGHVMFTTQYANGAHPRTAADFLLTDDRGSDLARRFLTDGTVEVCCDYCGQLMAWAMAAGVASQLQAIHGTDRAADQWDALGYAMTGPPF